MPSIPSSSREVRLKSCARGLPKAGDFELVEVPLPRPGPGQALLRNRYTLASASLRMMISEGAAAVEGVPLPPLRPGDTLGGESLGEVVAAPPGSGLQPGDLVRHHRGWRQYAAVPLDDCAPVRTQLPLAAAHLGHGWTAYAALTRGAQVRPGDTVFVASASSAIGSMAGQIARLLGAGRVVGGTGSRDKAERLVRELGYDAAVVRGAGPLRAQLARAAPDGVDVVLDLAGGEQLQAAIDAAREGARILVVGALSGQLASAGSGRTAPVELDTVQILVKKLTLRGYSADDNPEARDEWTARFGAWLDAGSIVFPHVLSKGLDTAPEVIQRVAEGRYFGTVIVEL